MPCRAGRAGSWPPSPRRAACRRRVELGRARGLDDERAEEAVRDGEAVARAGAQVVRALELLVVRHVVVVRARCRRRTGADDAFAPTASPEDSACRTRGRRCGCRARLRWRCSYTRSRRSRPRWRGSRAAGWRRCAGRSRPCATASCVRTASTRFESTYILPSGSWSPKRLSVMLTSMAWTSK